MKEVCYSFDEILVELNKEINRARALHKAWAEVSFPAKKNGEPFAIMSKNISGATYYSQTYTVQPGHYMVGVTCWCDGLGYISDDIKAHDLVRYADETKKAKVHNYLPKDSGLEQIYKYDIYDIKNEVQSRVKYWENKIENLEMQRNAAQDAFLAFRDAFNDAIKNLENATHKKNDASLFRTIYRTVTARYPYI